MRKDFYRSHRLTPNALIIEGSHTAMSVSFQALSEILEDLSKEFAEQDSDESIVPRPRDRRWPTLPPGIKYGSKE